MTENLNMFQIASLFLQCLSMLLMLGAIGTAFKGTNVSKVWNAKPEKKSDEKDPANGWYTTASILAIATLVFMLLGFATGIPSVSMKTVVAQTETAPASDQNLTPQPPAQDFSSYCNPAMPTGKTFTAPEGGTRLPNGTEITQGKAYMYRVINWSSDCKSAQVYLLFTMASPSYGTSGPNYDGSPNHDQQTWLFEGDHLDNLMPKAMCALARDTLSGALGKDTNVVVHYSNQTDGRYVDVPEACMP